tara:strand:- start:814 stop:1002 length:189 start_codon:yes stop_codon:yes gene_type:complete
MINKTILSEDIEVSIEEETAEGIYVIINHTEAETDYDMDFKSMDHMRVWANENNYTIQHINY